VFEDLYPKNENDIIYNVEYNTDGVMVLILTNEENDSKTEIDVREFEIEFNTEDKETFVLEQLALEADLCFGRNKY